MQPFWKILALALVVFVFDTKLVCAELLQVTAERPQQQEFAVQDHWTGRFSSSFTVGITPRVTGYIDSILVKDGQFMHKGETLLRIDPRQYALLVASAKANVESARAAKLYADEDLKRSEKLVNSGNISKQTNDQRLKASLSAAAAYDAAVAEQKRAELNLSFTQVQAPADGQIGKIELDPGNLVVADQTIVTTLNVLSPLYFSFAVDAASYLKYTETYGTYFNDAIDRVIPITVSLVDDPSKQFQGAIDFVDKVFDQSTGTVIMRAKVDNKNGMIRPGMFGVVKIASSKPKPTLFVPKESILMDQDKQIVYVVDNQNKVQKRTVILGQSDGHLQAILGGLTSSDRVVIDQLTKVREGMDVKVSGHA